jgi:ribosomal protein L29
MHFNNLTTKKLLEIAGVDVTKGKAKRLLEDSLQELKAELKELRGELASCSNDKTREKIQQDILRLSQAIKAKSGQE